jgi:beta-phosphoglucomutase
MKQPAFAVIFDFDGTIFESVKCHEACWREVLSCYGRTLTHQQFEEGLGATNEYFIKNIVQCPNVDELVALKEELYQKKALSGQIRPYQSSLDCIRRLHEAHVLLAIGTASSRGAIDRLLASYKDVYESFSAFITADQVTYGKPNPEIFLKAAAALQMNPHDCIVVEDAPSGILAAQTAGMKTVVLTTTFPASILAPLKPDVLVDSLAQVTFEQFASLVR